MKASDFNKMSGNQLARIPTPELKKLVSAQAQTANRRYQNIKSNPRTAKNAVRSVDKSGGRFSVKGKDNTQSLVLEAKRIQRFNKAKTGTVKGAIESKKAYEKAYKGKTAEQVGKEAEKKYKREHMEEARKAAAEKGKKVSKQTRKKIERESKKAGQRAASAYSEEAEQKRKEFDKDREDINKIASGLDAFDQYNEDLQNDIFMHDAKDVQHEFEEINNELGWKAFV